MSSRTNKMRSRPQVYTPLSFHIVRTIAFISAAVVSGILIYFCIQLRHDGFKLPWTFIIVLASTLLSLLSLFITGILYGCFFLSPLLALSFNVTVLILYFVGYCLLTWNIYGTLGHSCSRSNWASNDGMMICRTYKAFYSFEIFGVLAQVTLIILDIRSRRHQTKLGRYNKMAAVAAKGGGDVKLDDLHDRAVDDRAGLQHSHADSQDSIPYGVPMGDYNLNDSHARLRDNGADMPYSHGHPQQPMRMDDFRNDSSTSGYSYNSYAAAQPHGGYANSGYGYGPQR